MGNEKDKADIPDSENYPEITIFTAVVRFYQAKDLAGNYKLPLGEGEVKVKRVRIIKGGKWRG